MRTSASQMPKFPLNTSPSPTRKAQLKLLTDGQPSKFTTSLGCDQQMTSENKTYVVSVFKSQKKSVVESMF